MKVIEYLTEFDLMEGWRVRIWGAKPNMDWPAVWEKHWRSVAMAAREIQHVVAAEAFAAEEGVNAVQIEYMKGRSIIIYPDWP